MVLLNSAGRDRRKYDGIIELDCHTTTSATTSSMTREYGVIKQIGSLSLAEELAVATIRLPFPVVGVVSW